jgi:hypothetical protein
MAITYDLEANVLRILFSNVPFEEGGRAECLARH